MCRIYGKWSWDENGEKEDKTRCIKAVFPDRPSFVTYQCKRKRGYGKNGEYCKQHAKEHTEEN